MQALRWIERADELRAAGEDFRADVFCGELGVRVQADERGCQGDEWSAGAPKR